MNVYADQICQPKYALIYTSLLLVGAMTSCDKKGDPSYEKDALRLTAEKATAEANYKSAESKLTTAEATIASLRSEIESLKQKPREPEAPKVNIDNIKLGFMRDVEKLKTSVESTKTQHSVESVTFEKMTIPRERPFSSGVVMTLKSRQDGRLTKLRWLGHGSPEGNWIFEPSALVDNKAPNTPNALTTDDNKDDQQVVQSDKNKPIVDNRKNKRPKKIGTTQTVDKNGNRIIQIQFPEDENSSGNPSTGETAQPPSGNTPNPPTEAAPTPPKKTPPAPQKPQRPKQPIDPNTHKIDWDKLNK